MCLWRIFWCSLFYFFHFSMFENVHKKMLGEVKSSV